VNTSKAPAARLYIVAVAVTENTIKAPAARRYVTDDSARNISKAPAARPYVTDDSAGNISKAPAATTRGPCCAPRSFAALTRRGACSGHRRPRGCPFESHPTATAPSEDVPARSLGSLRGLRLPCSRSRCSRDRSLTPPQPRRSLRSRLQRESKILWQPARSAGDSEAQSASGSRAKLDDLARAPRACQALGGAPSHRLRMNRRDDASYPIYIPRRHRQAFAVRSGPLSAVFGSPAVRLGRERILPRCRSLMCVRPKGVI